MTAPAHTPTPWSFADQDVFHMEQVGPATRKSFIAAVSNQHNAAFIVRAVNAHDDLVAAALLARNRIDNSMTTATCHEVIARLDAAIAKARP